MFFGDISQFFLILIGLAVLGSFLTVGIVLTLALRLFKVREVLAWSIGFGVPALLVVALVLFIMWRIDDDRGLERSGHGSVVTVPPPTLPFPDE